MTDFTPKTPEQEVIRAGQARQIVESPLWIEACQRIEAGLAAQRRAVPMRETEMHTRLIIAEQLWSQFTDFFTEVMDSGRMAEFQIQQKRSRLQDAVNLFRR